MKLYVISYHHRGGVTVWPMWQDNAPSLETIAENLEDWEPETGEWLDMSGPFEIPSKGDAT